MPADDLRDQIAAVLAAEQGPVVDEQPSVDEVGRLVASELGRQLGARQVTIKPKPEPAEPTTPKLWNLKPDARASFIKEHGSREYRSQLRAELSLFHKQLTRRTRIKI